MHIKVECYSGYNANERPIKFWIGETLLFVESVHEQWHGTDGKYFPVHADDGNAYILRHDETADIGALPSR
jgi:hypothetical protein